MVVLFWLYIVMSVGLIALAIPLLLEKVPPNPLYGFRVRTTLENVDIWYATNRYSAGWLIASGIAMIVAAIGLRFVPGLRDDGYALGCLAVFTAVFIAGLVQTFRYMNALARQLGARSGS
ncbi:MAG: SdpI family protein [Isosphaeraceae bacterium]